MKYWFALLSSLLLGSLVWGQDTAPSAGCGKNVSFAIAEGGQPVPAIPKFTLKWLGSKSRQEGFSTLCFSQVPSLTQANYIVVFSTSPAAFQGLKASAHTYKTAPQAHEASASVNSYGGSWSYAYTGVTPPATTSTLDLRRDDKPKSLEVRAFDQSGRTISQGSLASISSRDKLLEKVLSDIVKDAAPTEARKPFASPLSVYYVNCDVDGPPVTPGLERTAAAAPPPNPTPASVTAAPPPPKPELDIWSSPAGADVFLDGQYVGQTPYSAEVALGQHTVDLRKKNYAIWQRKFQANAGKRRIGGNLEPKVLELQ